MAGYDTKEVGTGVGQLLIGVGIVTVQASAVIPGLLPCLLLLGILVIPLLVIGAAVAVLAAIPYGLWRGAGLLIGVRPRVPARGGGRVARPSEAVRFRCSDTTTVDAGLTLPTVVARH